MSTLCTYLSTELTSLNIVFVSARSSSISHLLFPYTNNLRRTHKRHRTPRTVRDWLDVRALQVHRQEARGRLPRDQWRDADECVGRDNAIPR